MVFIAWFNILTQKNFFLNELCNIMQQLIFGIYNTIEIILITLCGNFLIHMFNSPYIGPLINKGVHLWLNHQYPKWWQGESHTCVPATPQAKITTDYPYTPICNGESNPIWDSHYLSTVYALCMVWIEYNEQNNACLQTMKMHDMNKQKIVHEGRAAPKPDP